MIEFWQHAFLIRALCVGSVMAITCAIAGNFLVAGRQAMIADMLSHTALAGVGVGFFLSIHPLLSAVLTSTCSSLILVFFWNKKKFPPEAVAMLLLTGGLAVIIFFSHLARNSVFSLETFLFGNILLINSAEATWFLIVNIFILCCLFFWWRSFFIVCLDKNFARERLKHYKFFEIIFVWMIAIITSISLKVIGGLLVGAMLVIPVLTAQVFSKSFMQSVLLSVCFNFLGIILGILSSLWVDIPTSSAIVFVLILFFFVSYVVKFFFIK